ncbi:PAS domain S-box protein [Niabella yanshanensis]|uniref:PAS domain S-box protein n=1 Tax=Niabella yanshanensis TaxID=577386 RepID=A0ABZ0WAJ8_9BACT|nr:PAS domain S-box protein [Niabella yanshanensis]WQD39522.1 PAS domain S-box protein [Niabella yanshanensis]
MSLCFAAVFDNMEDAVIAHDANGVIFLANPAVKNTFGYDPETLIGKDVRILIPARLRPGYEQLIKEVYQGRKITGKTSSWLNSEGVLVPVSLILAPINDQQGASIGVSAIFRTIYREIDAEVERNHLRAIIE